MSSSNNDVVEELGTERSAEIETPEESVDSNEQEESQTTSEGDTVKPKCELTWT